MSELVLTNIGELVTNDANVDETDLGLISNAAVIATDGLISWIGRASELPDTDSAPIDLVGKSVIPGFVDSHAHLMFAGERSAEFAARMAGEPYTGGGIRTTVAATRQASDEQLRANVRRLLHEMRSSGITTFEIKSGYGLDTQTESRSLAIAREFTQETTFLGAHVVPTEYSDQADEYVELVCGEMLEACAPNAKWIDVFCERGAFTIEQSRKVLEAGISKGLLPRIHANQLTSGQAVALAVEVDAAAADHLTYLSDEDIDLLANSNTVATLLPGVEFSTRSPYPRARDLIAAGVSVAIATDCNPGSCYSNSMPFMIALAVREMRMTPAEALKAATLGGAAALRRTDVGALRIGMQADLVALNAPSYLHLAYRPGVNIIDQVWSSGKAN